MHNHSTHLPILASKLHSSLHPYQQLTSQTFANVLFHLAAEPHKYLQPLRDEVEEVVAKHGWTKTAMREMYKLDGFLRESGRYNGLGCCEFFFLLRVDFSGR